MVATKDAVIAQALTLSEPERLEVIERLSASLKEPADEGAAEAWDAEIDRRLDGVAAGRATVLSWDEARRRILGEAGEPQA